jgi:exosortase
MDVSYARATHRVNNLAIPHTAGTSPQTPAAPSIWKTWWPVLLLLVPILWLFAAILTRLASDWWNDPNFSHGFFVPLFGAYVIWQSRKRLATLPIEPSWFGLVVIAGAMATVIVGVLGAELFLSRSAFVLLLMGMVIYFLGWRWFRELLFPLACLFLMIPIPAILFNQVAFPLQLLASKIASVLLGLFGVPVLREGNMIYLPHMALEVVEACSGIRSLVSLVTLAIIYGYFMDRGFVRRALLALGAIPIAVLANALRVMGTGLLGHFWDPEKAEGFFHTFSGLVIFSISLALLFSLHGLIRFFLSWRQRSEAA